MRLIRERARKFNLNVFKLPKFAFMPLWFNPKHTEQLAWSPHEKVIFDRAKLANFYDKMKEKDDSLSSQLPEHDLYRDFMSKPKEEKIFRVYSAPFKSQLKFDLDLEAAVNKLLIDAVNRYRISFSNYSNYFGNFVHYLRTLSIIYLSPAFC